MAGEYGHLDPYAVRLEQRKQEKNLLIKALDDWLNESPQDWTQRLVIRTLRFLLEEAR